MLAPIAAGFCTTHTLTLCSSFRHTLGPQQPQRPAASWPPRRRESRRCFSSWRLSPQRSIRRRRRWIQRRCWLPSGLSTTYRGRRRNVSRKHRRPEQPLPTRVPTSASQRIAAASACPFAESARSVSPLRPSAVPRLARRPLQRPRSRPPKSRPSASRPALL